MANWMDNYAGTLGFKLAQTRPGIDRVAKNPNAWLEDYYGAKGAEIDSHSRVRQGVDSLNALVLSGAGQAVGGLRNAGNTLGSTYDYLFGTPTANPQQQQLTDSAKTAEQAIQPDPAQVEQKAAELAKQEKVKKANQQAAVEQALLNSDTVRLGGGGSSSKDVAMPEMAALTQAEPAKEPEQDFSKAMLRAGIAMMQSKGDIWDAIGAGFGGYQASLDQQEADKAKAEKEARELAMEQYKMDLYGKQVMFPYWNAQRGGTGGGSNWKEQNAERRLDNAEAKLNADNARNNLKAINDELLMVAPGTPQHAQLTVTKNRLMADLGLIANMGGIDSLAKP